MLVSKMAETLIGSEIIKLAGEINEKKKNGENIYNFTIGDFDPAIFPIPAELKSEIVAALEQGHTNYPPANGMQNLRQELSTLIKNYRGLNYSPEEILIAGGARPLIYAIYRTLLDPGDKVIFPVPSWNNNHYCHLTNAEQVLIETLPENNFMPTAADIMPYIKDATLVSLCSPLNPTGTVFKKEQLADICRMIIEENKRRGDKVKPVYLMYDQIYWMLTFGEAQHYDPVSLFPELRPYTVNVDGLSKAFAATGVRVGWSFGPDHIISRMKSILSHIGAWAPKAEQVACAHYLSQKDKVKDFVSDLKNEIEKRLKGFYDKFKELKQKGYPVDAIAPEGAIYLTVKIDLKGATDNQGKKLETNADVQQFLLNIAKIALVPFSAFGSSKSANWYRLSVGTCKLEEVDVVMNQLEVAMKGLKY